MIKAKKSLGQNFLRNENIIRKIVHLVDAKPDEPVIEIGPGTGALTRYLFATYPQMTAIELDQRAIEVLQSQLSGLHVLHKDVLKVSWKELYEAGGNKPLTVIGNLPYYITSPILFSVLDEMHLFKKAIFMMQREVADRIVAKIRTKDYGILSVQTQLLSVPKFEFDVSRYCFAPVPNVESAIVSFTPAAKPLGVPLDEFKSVVKTAFNQRRKTLRNALKSKLGSFSDEVLLAKRAEELRPEEFVQLTKDLMKANSEL